MPELPNDVKRVLTAQPGTVCSMLVVNDLAAVVVKTARQDIESFRGPVPVLYRYELGRYPEGAAIRVYLEILDKPGRPYQLETFLNLALWSGNARPTLFRHRGAVRLLKAIAPQGIEQARIGQPG
jgi:hypothetical protein